MDLTETEPPPAGREAKIIEAIALALDIAIVIYDRNDKVIAGSSQLRRFTNIPPEMVVPGARLRDILGASYDVDVKSNGPLSGNSRIVSRDDWVAEHIATHWRERFESVRQFENGRWVRICSRRMPDGVLVVILDDVSEQVRRDEELSETRQQAELAQHILDNLANPVVVKDSSMHYVAVNEAFCRIPGLRPKHIIGRTAKDLVDLETAIKFETIERKVLETGVPHEVEEDIVRRDGSIMHTVTRIHRSGKPGNHYVTISFDDISEYVKPEDRGTEVPTQTGIRKREAGVQAQETERILVLEADKSRGERRVATLRRSGADALLIAEATEAFAFLAEAEKMHIRIDRIELCDAMGAKLISHEETVQHPLLSNALAAWRKATVRKPSIHAGRSGAEVVEVQRPEPEVPAVPASVGPVSVLAEPTVSQGVGSVGQTISSSNTGTERLRILVAEDNHVNQVVFEQILEGIDVDFRIVENGEEAVAAWQSSAPDLVLMDVSMPIMNGLQATQAIRKAEAGKTEDEPHTPIIAVTAHAMSGDRERCFDAGMDDYLSKPVSPDKLEAIIEKWVGKAAPGAAVAGAHLG